MSDSIPAFSPSELSSHPQLVLEAVSQDDLVNLFVANYLEQAASAEEPLKQEVQQAARTVQEHVLAFYAHVAKQVETPINAAADRIEKAFVESGVAAHAGREQIREMLFDRVTANADVLVSNSSHREYAHGRTPLVDVVTMHIARRLQGPHTVNWTAPLSFFRSDGSLMASFSIPVGLVLETPPACLEQIYRWETASKKLHRLQAIQSDGNIRALERKARAELTRRALAGKNIEVALPPIESLA